MSQGRKVYLEAMRVIAVILVIYNHTDGFVYYTVTDNIITYLFSLSMSVLCRAAVPLFFMITGALLLEREESLSELMKKRVLRMIVVLFTISLAYYIFDLILDRIENAGIMDFVIRLISNGTRESFWFLYSYLFMLLLLPFFRKMAPFLNGQLIRYLMCLMALSSFFVPLINMWCGVSFTFDVGFAGGYFYYVLLGYFMSHDGKEVFQKMKTSVLCLCLIGLIALNMLIMYLLNQRCGAYQTAGLDFFVFLTAPLIWLIMEHVTRKIPGQSKLNKGICTLGSCVFGIYLLDNFLRWQFLPVYLYLTEKTIGVLACSVYIALVFGVGFLYTWILKRIPGVRRYL
ncbi:MAG: acyltransferase [Lachnospiraceae bacterium]|nr:acyltransferase [Lachnospiraceae bacterium]MDD7628530.1 acyltransferase [Lachnospiraceae bacterium]MDY4120056.1 acyltransferase [Lachnospiraceae bacterium]